MDPFRIGEFKKAAREWATAYATDNILMPMGEDFNYQNANMWYKNIDKLIQYVNAGSHNPPVDQPRTLGHHPKPIHAFYSTPSCYLKALNDANITWSSKSDDFFPYASDPHAFWTGYFTSRSAFKGMIRSGNNMLQVKQVLSRNLQR
jgi:lysosomal alpha-mannosidase